MPASLPISIQLSAPYLIFLGDVNSMAFAKTALGVVQWAPASCVAQLRFDNCPVDAGLTDMTVNEAAAAGAKSLLIGSAPVGGAIQENWIPSLLAAIEAGMDIVSGLHTKLNDYPVLRAAAEKYHVRLIDVRVPPLELPIGNGQSRSGQRLLTVGTDCSVGKKYTALAITQALKQKGVNCDFRATGQTGVMIAGSGMPIDAVVADFIAGAAEALSPDNAAEHWDIIEGQGSLFQPAYSGVSLGLLHGSQPDAIVVCHDPGREHIIGCPDHAVPSVQQCIETNLQLGRLTNPQIRCLGVSVNTSSIAKENRQAVLDRLQQETNLPCIDPLIEGVDSIVEALLRD
jgi:uncharacterized NAD-dependent epimerase/dehydratase family protein